MSADPDLFRAILRRHCWIDLMGTSSSFSLQAGEEMRATLRTQLLLIDLADHGGPSKRFAPARKKSGSSPSFRA
jgi:hypothetical protein